MDEKITFSIYFTKKKLVPHHAMGMVESNVGFGEANREVIQRLVHKFLSDIDAWSMTINKGNFKHTVERVEETPKNER